MGETQANILQRTQSSTIDTCQNQLAKMPKNFLFTNGPRQQTRIRTNRQNAPKALGAQKRTVPVCTQVNLLGLGAYQLIQMHLSIPLRESGSWQTVPSRGETEGSAAAKNISQSPSGTSSLEQEGSSLQPAQHCQGGGSIWENLGSQIL